VFDVKEGYEDMPVEVPCGRCIGCKLEHSRQWAMRCMHEASLYEKNCFITLTYDEKHLPPDESLHLDHFQKFMKRLRKEHGKVRYYHCGEYGEKFQRPHYHALLFGFDFPDKTLFRIIPGGTKLYISNSLKSLWTFGHHTIGDVTFESAAYVARYCTKKLTGNRPFIHTQHFKDGTKITNAYENSDEHYQIINYDTGEVTYRAREYATMSRNKGIGQGWIEKYKSDVYPADHVIVRGKPVKPPRYYDAYLEALDITAFQNLKKRRQLQSKKHTGDRLEAMEKVKFSKIKSLTRKYENADQNLFDT
jgi:hypothetical protein